MASNGLRGLNEAMKGLRLSSQICKDAVSHRITPSTSFSRSMATEVTPTATATNPVVNQYKPATTVPVTIFGFPSYEPLGFEVWSRKHLGLPLRRDLLHLAVIYEGDNTRQGTASTKNRWEVRGSGRKIRPQKGTGRARLGDAQSPMLKGGGRAHGPKPRDFGTKINRKVYDMAWRTALSYRYRRGELVVCENGMDLPLPAEYFDMLSASQLKEEDELAMGFKMKMLRQMMEHNEWGRQQGRSTFISSSSSFEDSYLAQTLDAMPKHGRAMCLEEVDVKDLLTTGRLVIERDALRDMIQEHQSDLVTNVSFATRAAPQPPRIGSNLVN